MTEHHRIENAEVEDPERDWYISRCAHGGLHLALERVMVSLSEEEFLALERLVVKAREQLIGRHVRVSTAGSTRHH